jgi:hypothetical protein
MRQSLTDFLVVIISFINSNNGGITALATVVIAAFTITLWLATSRQAELTREALIANKRAFVYPISISQFFEPANTTGQFNWRFRPVLRNSGDTPTKNMTMFVTCEVRNSAIPIGYPFTDDAQRVARVTIAPRFDLQGGVVPQAPAAAITPQDIIDAQAGRKFIYVWGWIKYSDVFPKTPPHITRYCWLVLPVGDPLTFVPHTPGQPPTPGTLSFNTLHHTEGNCIDEECG